MDAVRRSGSSACVLHTAITDEILAGDSDVNDRFHVYEPGFPTVHRRGQLALDLTIDGSWLARKLRALRCHASQTTGIIDAIGVDRYRRWITPELFVVAEQANVSSTPNWERGVHE